MLDRLSSILGRASIQALCGVACFVAFTWPVMTGYADDDPLASFFKLFLVWAVFVFVLYLLTRVSSFSGEGRSDTKQGPGSE